VGKRISAANRYVGIGNNKILFGAVPTVVYVIELEMGLYRSVQNKATTPFGVVGSGIFPPAQHPLSVLARSKVMNPFETI
jgi:hypothetical protein